MRAITSPGRGTGRMLGLTRGHAALTLAQALVQAILPYGPSYLGLGNASAGMDDYSGNGLTATFAVAPTTPDGGKTLILSANNNTGAATGSRLDIAGLTADLQASTFFVLHQSENITIDQSMVSPAGGSWPVYCAQFQAGSTIIYSSGFGNFLPKVAQTSQLPVVTWSNPCVWSVTNGATSIVYRVNGQETTGDASPAGSVTGWQFFGIAGVGYQLRARVQAVVAFPRALNSTERAAVETALANFGGVQVSTSARMMLADGDSQVQCYRLLHPITDSFLALANTALGNPYQLVNLAVAGAQTANVSARTPLASALIARTPDVTQVLDFGTNNLATGSSGADTYAAVKAVLAARKALGGPLIYFTPKPRGSDDTQRQAFLGAVLGDFPVATVFPNIWLPAPGITYATILVNVAGDSRFAFGSHTAGVYFDPDQIHINEAGNAVEAEYLQRALSLT